MQQYQCSDGTVKVRTVLSRRAARALQPYPCGDGIMEALTVLSQKVGGEAGKVAAGEGLLFPASGPQGAAVAGGAAAGAAAVHEEGHGSRKSGENHAQDYPARKIHRISRAN